VEDDQAGKLGGCGDQQDVDAEDLVIGQEFYRCR
jgi:hypothetical protein